MRVPRTRVRAKRRAFPRVRRDARRVASAPTHRIHSSSRRLHRPSLPRHRVPHRFPSPSRVLLATVSPPRARSLARSLCRFPRAVGTTDRSFDSRPPRRRPRRVRARDGRATDERRRLLASASRRGPPSRASRTPSRALVIRPRVSRPRGRGPSGYTRSLDTVKASFSTCVRVRLRPSRSFTFSMCARDAYTGTSIPLQTRRVCGHRRASLNPMRPQRKTPACV